MNASIEQIIQSETLYSELFGSSSVIHQSKRSMLKRVWRLFNERFGTSITGEGVHLIAVPNRVELLGKHTDYQGGETLVLAGPKNFFALAARSNDGVSHFVNADCELGETVLSMGDNGPELLSEGVGSNYTYRVAERLQKNLVDAGFPSLGNVKAVFFGDIPIGGGTSGSSAKVICDFLAFTTTHDLIDAAPFAELIQSNGRKAGLELDQEGLDNYRLALSMYIAHYENGLDFGDLKGDRGVGTFGGSEDHTAIVLGEKNMLLFCQYCPTKLMAKVAMPGNYSVVVAYSGKRAEKTRDAMAKYNRLSGDASQAVQTLNGINGTGHTMLRDFFPDSSFHDRTTAAMQQLQHKTELRERAYQFFKEREIIYQAVTSLKESDMKTYGALINESHKLSRTYLKNIADEVHHLQLLANELGALGATGFGGGFGGSCYALVQEGQANDFVAAWRDAYHGQYTQYADLTQFDIYPPCSGAYWCRVDV
jgi:galactokinase